MRLAGDSCAVPNIAKETRALPRIKIMRIAPSKAALWFYLNGYIWLGSCIIIGIQWCLFVLVPVSTHGNWCTFTRLRIIFLVASLLSFQIPLESEVNIEHFL